MADAVKSLEKQIETCKQLLKIFQDERERFLSGVNPTVKETMACMEHKRKVLEMFEEQRSILSGLKQLDNPVEEAERKQRTRELAGVIEQLLVIDQENERLIRESISRQESFSRRPAARPAAPQPLNTAKTRPGLQRQLPLMPFGGSNMLPPINHIENEMPRPSVAGMTAMPEKTAVRPLSAHERQMESAARAAMAIRSKFQQQSIAAEEKAAEEPELAVAAMPATFPKAHLKSYTNILRAGRYR